jgi:hypothetical protein
MKSAAQFFLIAWLVLGGVFALIAWSTTPWLWLLFGPLWLGFVNLWGAAMGMIPYGTKLSATKVTRPTP